MVDIGTGDGTFAYHIAKESPQSFVIGIDPCYKNLIELSAKTLKKPSKGGLKNLMFVLANVDDLPEELTGIADTIYINFPWGSLLQGIVQIKEVMWHNIKKIAKKNATVQIIFGYDAAFEASEVKRLELPELNDSFFKETLVPKLKSLGFEVEMQILSSYELASYPTTWARTLRFGQNRTYYRMNLKLRQ